MHTFQQFRHSLFHVLWRNNPDHIAKAEDPSVLKQIFDSAVEDGLMSTNPAKSTRLQNPGKPSLKRDALKADAVKDIVASLPNLRESDRRFMALCLFTGMRKGEIIGLRWEDIDIANNLIRVRRSANVNKGRAVLGEPKTASGKRDIPIAPQLLRLLSPLKTTGFVVVGVRDGLALSISLWLQTWTDVLSAVCRLGRCRCCSWLFSQPCIHIILRDLSNKSARYQ